MKMTEAIRDYITEQVAERINNAYAAQREELKLKRDKETEKWNDTIEAFSKETNLKLKELLDSFGYNPSENASPYVRNPTISVNNFLPSYLPNSMAYKDFLNKVDKKIDTTTKDIIVTMELGGTKTELMRMLNEIEVC